MRYLVLTFLLTACSLPFNSRGPVFRTVGTDKVFVGGCQQSTFAVGADATAAFSLGLIGAAIQPVDDDTTAVRMTLLITAPIFIASAIYGAVKSGRCRDLHRQANLPVFGKNDWIWPPIITTSVLSIAGLAVAATRGPGSYSGGTSKSGVQGEQCSSADATAVCTDGTMSCARHSGGSCSRHDGVRCLMKPIPTRSGGNVMSEIPMCDSSADQTPN